MTSIVVLPRLMAEAKTPEKVAVCIFITNPSQSPARLDAAWHDVLRLGFHDTDRPGCGFTAMSVIHAHQVLEFASTHRGAPLTVHCEAGASRSVGRGVFLAAWRREHLRIQGDVLFPNPWVMRQLRLAGFGLALRLRDPRPWTVSWKGPMTLRSEFAASNLYVPPHLI